MYHTNLWLFDRCHDVAIHGLDEISSILFREFADLPFYLLVNQCFAAVVFPERLKKAVIQPLYEKRYNVSS